MPLHDHAAIDVKRSEFVRLTFVDGLVAEFPLAPLRLACPCADCNARRRDGRPVSTAAETDPDGVAIATASMAGAWGLNLDWADGHTTGIYSFERLREWADIAEAGEPLVECRLSRIDPAELGRSGD
ncbi:MAG: DUF971 domain-containing protein [Actinomycetota bacterium]